jgi:hypothetical protein
MILETQQIVSFERHLQMMSGNFGHFPTYHMKILFGDFNAKLGGEDIFKQMIGNESLH